MEEKERVLGRKKWSVPGPQDEKGPDSVFGNYKCPRGWI